MAEPTIEELAQDDGEYDIQLQIDGLYFGMSVLRSVSTVNQLCDIGFEIGQTACGQIDIEMEKPADAFSRMARIVPYTRRIDCEPEGEWTQQGVYYIDTRETEIDGENDILHLTGYDGMLKTSKDYGDLGLSYPARTLDVVLRIAELSGLEVEEHTKTVLDDGQTIPKPEYYTGREILGFVAIMYAGSFMMDRLGKLKLVNMAALLSDADDSSDRILANQADIPIEIGGACILA